jgi:transposase-like protein
MLTAPLACPSCNSTHIVKNGKIHNGKQNFKCRECGRQFVQDPQNKIINKIIDQATKTLIDKLLLEKIPLAGIVRVVGVSEPWLQSYVNAKYQNVPRQVNVRAKKRAFNHSV